MAWSIVGVGGLTTAASGNLTPSEPAGVQEGDLLVACIAYRDAAAFTQPSGWTMIEQQSSGDIDNTNGIASVAMAYIVRGASAPALTFTRTAGDVGMIRIMAYRGNHASPLGAHSSNTLAVASGTNTTGTITTGGANSLIVAVSAAGDNLSHSSFDATDPGTASASTPDTTTAPTAGTWIERADTGTATGADCGLAIADAVRATAGATGTIQCVVSVSARHAMAAAEFLISNAISGSLSATLDPVTLAADGDLTIQGSLAATIDPITATGAGSLTIEGEATNTIAPVTLAGTASLSISGALNATLDNVTLAASGSQGSLDPISGALAVTLPPVTLGATGSLSISGVASATLGGVTLSATGALTNRGSLSAQLAPVVLVANGSSGGGNSDSDQNYGWRGRRWTGNGKRSVGAGLWRTN